MVSPRCDHVGPLGSRGMMRASVRVSGVTLRPGVPGSLGCGAAARQGALTPLPCLEPVVGDVAFGPIPGSRDRLSGRLCWGPGGSRAMPALGGGRGVPVPHQSVAGRPSRPVVPKTVGELFEVDSESEVGTRVTRPRVGIRVVLRPTLSQPQVPRPPGRASTPRRPNELAASNVSRDEVTRWRSTGGDGCCCRGSRTLLVLR
jgi:hypothetical protein